MHGLVPARSKHELFESFAVPSGLGFGGKRTLVSMRWGSGSTKMERGTRVTAGIGPASNYMRSL